MNEVATLVKVDLKGVSEVATLVKVGLKGVNEVGTLVKVGLKGVRGLNPRKGQLKEHKSGRNPCKTLLKVEMTFHSEWPSNRNDLPFEMGFPFEMAYE